LWLAVTKREDGMRSTLHKALTAAFLMLVAFIPCSAQAAAAGAANTIRYGIDDDANINRLPQVIAEREGFFEREGVRLQIVPFGDSFRTRTGQASPTTGAAPLTLRQGMAQGSIDMSRQQFPLLIADVLGGGGKNVAVAAVVNNPIYYLVVRPEIKSFADLKGKAVSITRPDDGITIWTRKLMAQHGLKNEDTTLKRIAGSGARVDCLKTAECAGSALAQPAVFNALDAGNHSLAMTNEIGPMMYQFDVANAAWAAAHRDLVVRYIRALTAANRFIMDPKNRDEVVKATMGFMHEPENRTRQMLAAMVEPKSRVLPVRAEIDMNQVKAAIALLGEYNIVKQPLPAPERFVDASYSKAAGP
jgi:ABC-type nitrate/sulfonate/bicarbonate transport system substrate-binding protein